MDAAARIETSHDRYGNAAMAIVRAVQQDAPLQFRVLTSEEQWSALQPAWDGLLLASPGHTVFQSYDYLRLWWRHFGDSRRLFIVVMSRGDDVVGIAPLQVETSRYLGRDYRELCFIGSRWEVDRPVFLVPGAREDLLRSLIAFLVEQRQAWDLCQFYEQIAGSETLRLLEQAFRESGCLVGSVEDSACPYLELSAGWQAFLTGKTQKFRKNLKAAGRKLREMGTMQYQVHDRSDELAKQLDLYRALEARSWKQEESVGVGRSDQYFAFYRDLAGMFGPRRGFMVRTLSLDGRPVAATFGLQYNGVYYSLQIAHDRDFDRCSPGTYLEALEIEECFGSGQREYDFLGGFLNNKSRWTTTFRHTRQLFVYRRTPLLMLMYGLFFVIKPRIKSWLRPYMKSWRKADEQAA